MNLLDEVRRALKAFDPAQPRDRAGRWVRNDRTRIFHGTTSKLWAKIKADGGIRPTNETGVRHWGSSQERGQYVYVADTEREALGWGMSAKDKMRFDRKSPVKNQSVVVLTVEIPDGVSLDVDEGLYFDRSRAPAAYKFKGTIPLEWIKGHKVWTQEKIGDFVP